MPMSKVRTCSWLVAIAPSTPAAAARLVTTATSAKRPSTAPSVEPALKPNQPNHSISTASPTSGMEWPGITFGLAVLAVLAVARAEQQQRGERAGRADQVDHGRAGEVLHAEVGLQPAAAEDPVADDRVDQRAEDDRVDQVGAELDALERRAPDDRERDRAEHELEEELGRHRGAPRTPSPGTGRRCSCRGRCPPSPRTSPCRRTRARTRPPSSRARRSRSSPAPWARSSPRSSCARSRSRGTGSRPA